MWIQRRSRRLQLDHHREDGARRSDNYNERMESLLPWFRRGARTRWADQGEGRRNTQSGALINSANVTDPVTGGPANLPIDVVQSVQVVSNPYTCNMEDLPARYRMSRRRQAATRSIASRSRTYSHGCETGMGASWIGAATPRMTLSGPLIADKVSFVQSFEYRFVRTRVNSLPPLERDQTVEGFDTYTHTYMKINPRQTATVSLAMYPQKLQYMGLNTFTPQPAMRTFTSAATRSTGNIAWLPRPRAR